MKKKIIGFFACMLMIITVFSTGALVNSTKTNMAVIGSGESRGNDAHSELQYFDPGLVAWWKFDEGDGNITYDSSGNENHGTICGGATWVDGVSGGALRFDGLDGLLFVVDSESLSFTNDELTIEAWVKLDTLPEDPGYVHETSILRKDNQWAIQFYNASTIRDLVKTDDITGWTNTNDEQYAFEIDTWYYWTFVYNGSHIVHLINAEQVGSVYVVTGNIIDNANPVYIGYNPFMCGKYLSGIIDEVRIYNRVLTTSEIQKHYENIFCADAHGPYSGVVGEEIQFTGSAHGGYEPYTWYWEFGDGHTSTLQNPSHNYTLVDTYNVTLTVTDSEGNSDSNTVLAYIYYPEPGPVAYWHFDEGSGDTVYDISGNENHGTIHGASWTTGVSGDALHFDGINDYIIIGDSDSLSFTNDKLTIEAWVNVDTLPVQETSILRKDNQWAIEFYHLASWNKIRNLARTDGTNGWIDANDEPYVFETDTWYYWTFIYNGSHIVHKINAEQVGSPHIVTGNIIDNSNPVYIGYCPYTGRYLNGTIDEIRIYNRALTDEEIQAHYEEYVPLRADANGPYYGIVNEPIQFNGSVLGGAPLYNWSWDFGDGNTAEEQNTTHAYTLEGIYNVTLTVTDDYGDSDSDITRVVVYSTCPVHNIDRDIYYLAIQEAIDDAEPRNTIQVSTGTYYENVVINKAINLMGEDKNDTVIDGSGNGEDVVSIPADGANISGFTIQNSYNGIDVELAANNTIAGNDISNNFFGIRFVSSTNNTVTGNTISESQDGIRLEYSSTGNAIIGNTVKFNNGHGIKLPSAICNTITGNIISSNNLDGIEIKDSNGNTISHNTISLNGFDGIYLYRSNNNTLTSNTISDNSRCGCFLHSSEGNVIVDNTIRENNENGISLWFSTDNLIYHNNLINNTQNAYEKRDSNIWNDSYPSGGNYFDDHPNFVDLFSGPNQDEPGSDGICDVPYNIEEVDNKDWYPLMEPWGENPPYPPTITGPISGYVDEEYEYTFNATDPNGDDIFYYVDWGDGNTTGWIGPYPSGGEIIRAHAWSEPGTYATKAKAKDEHSAESDWSEPLSVHIVPHLVGDADGPYSGIVGEVIHFDGTVSGGAPPYMYHWDFGDGNTSDILDPDHAYTAPGVYMVAFMVTDAVGSVNDTTTATITAAEEPTLEIRDIKGGFSKVSAVIKNVGSVNASNVPWNISVNGGIFKRINVLTSGTITKLAVDQGVTIQTDMPIVGFGKVTIIVKVRYGETWTGSGFVFGPFVLGLKEK